MTQPPAIQKKILRRPEWLAAILITAAIVWLHFYFLLHAGGFWRDEVNLINLAGRHSLGDMSKDSFPALMPLLVHGWIAAGLGQNDLSLRLLGFLAGLGIPAALWAAAWTARRSPPLSSLALLGLNMTVISYGDSLRAYGLGSLFIVLTVAAMWAFLKNPSWPRAGILAAAAILSVQSLYQNAVLFAAICFGAWTICIRRKNFQAAAKILLAAIAAAASLLPYFKIIFSLPEASAPLRVGFQPAIVFANFDTAVAFPLSQYVYVWEFFSLALFGLAGATLFVRHKKSEVTADEISADDLSLFAGATLLAAVTGFAGFLWYAALLTQPWYFLPLMTLAAACFEFGLPTLTLPRLIRVIAFGLIMATALIAAPFAQRDLDFRFTNVDILARRLKLEAAPEDLILVNPWSCGISFDRYFKSATPWMTVPPLTDHATHRFDLVKAQMQNTNAIQPVLEQIAATLQAGHCVWVVGSLDILAPGAPPPSALPPPPLKHTGWLDTPYCFTWAAETAWFLGNHSLQLTCVDSATNASVSYFENLKLFRACGWKNFDSSQTNKP